MSAAFENTERDRLAWRERAWTSEEEAAALRAELELLRETVRRLVDTYQRPETAWQPGSACEAAFLRALAGEGEA